MPAPTRRNPAGTPAACTAIAAALLAAVPLRAQEVTGGAPAASAPSAAIGPVGAPVGGGSLGDPAAAGFGAASAPTVRLGPFGAILSAAESTPEGPGRAWTIIPSIGLFGGATNNVYQSSSNAVSDTFLEFSPGIVIDGSTARVRATLNYTPTARLYATYTDQNNVAQIGAGQILAELVPDALYLDIRGSASLGTGTGGFAPGTAQNAQRDNQTQYYNFMASPYYLYRFGSLATAQIGYVFQYFSQSGTNVFQPGTAQPFFDDQDYVANRGYAVVRSGEDLGRLALQARVDGTAFTGGGVYDGAHLFVTALEARYAILPTVAVLLEGGYENIEYGGSNPQHISDAIWSVGLRLTPSPETYLLVRYGHRGGFNSPSLEASIRLGAYTRLTASYAEVLGTSGTLAQDLLTTTTLDALGNPVDSQSGAPVVYANPFFASNSGLYRVKSGTVALSISWPRDSITLFANYQQQDPVSAAPGTQISEWKGYYGGVSWTHVVSPRTAVSAAFQYGRTEYAATPSLDALYLTAAVSHRLGLPGMTATARVYWNNQTSKQPDVGYGQATILVGVVQTF